MEDLPVALPTGNETTDHLILRSLLHNNPVRRALNQMGYRFVAFETGFLFSQFENADFYLSAGKWEGLNSFEVLLIQTSGGLVLDDVTYELLESFDKSMDDPEAIRYRQVMFTLDWLKRIPAYIPGPKFVFAHIVAPHLPFVFGADGQPVHYAEHPDDVAYLQGYRDELIYLNQSMKEVVERILSDSLVPPIIIIQSDHGHDYASRADRMAILNAYYLPGGGEAQLYPSISPVNSFRVVFNQHFGGEFELLEDRSYFSYYLTPFEFNYIPNECK